MQCLPKQISDMGPALGGVVLTVLHWVVSLYQFLHKHFLVLKSKWLGRTTNKCSKSASADFDLVSSKAKMLRQIPHHIVIILGSESISVNDFVNLAAWSIAAGAAFVSFYDYKGSLKECKDHYDQALHAAVGKTLTVPLKNGHKMTENGISNRKTPCISLLSVHDGKELIVNVARKLCAEARDGLIPPGKPSQDELDEILIKESGLPEAQLAIYFGSSCCMYGFMPWHARVTEFLPLQNCCDITVTDFLWILRKYDRCEQRLGK